MTPSLLLSLTFSLPTDTSTMSGKSPTQARNNPFQNGCPIELISTSRSMPWCVCTCTLVAGPLRTLAVPRHSPDIAHLHITLVVCIIADSRHASIAYPSCETVTMHLPATDWHSTMATIDELCPSSRHPGTN